jgi:hypothetical protein
LAAGCGFFPAARRAGAFFAGFFPAVAAFLPALAVFLPAVAVCLRRAGLAAEVFVRFALLLPLALRLAAFLVAMCGLPEGSPD